MDLHKDNYKARRESVKSWDLVLLDILRYVFPYSYNKFECANGFLYMYNVNAC